MVNPHQFPDVWLTTLDDLKLHRGINWANTPEDGKYTPEEMDALLKQCILDASASILDELGRLPLPYRASLTNLPAPLGTVLYVGEDVLELNSVTLMPDEEVIAAPDYTGYPVNRYPYYELHLTETCNVPTWRSFVCCGTPTVSLTGIFGYVPHWQYAWKPSGQVVPVENLTAAATTLTLPSVSAFKIGAYGRIDDEYVQVIGRSVGESNGTLTLERGVLGTTAVEHSAGAVIDLFRHVTDIQTKATDWAAYLYKSLEQLGEEVKVFEGGVQFVRGLSPLVKKALARHRRL